ncbi:MAG: sigma-70 family RNA polymerase sigma factor [Archangiaceae bacterium]|nr:sigma-70 family RNA polymerase sigma factor [Archangiaceae bacterium]
MSNALPALAHQADAELRALLARRDERAAAWLYDTFEDEVNRIVWSLLGADRDHDDIVHEALCMVLKGAHTVHDLNRLKGWVRTVTVNAVRLTLRKRKWLRLFGALEDDPQGERFEALVPDEAQRESARRLYRALDALSADERNALVLRHVEGFELTEVAEACGVSLATIKRWLQRAEQKVKSRVEQRGSDDSVG